MKILLPVDGSDFTQRMLRYIAEHDELLGPGHDYTAFTAVPRQVRVPSGAAEMAPMPAPCPPLSDVYEPVQMSGWFSLGVMALSCQALLLFGSDTMKIHAR